MFKAFQSIVSPSTRAGGYTRQRNNKIPSTTFSDSTGPVIRIRFKIPGERGNNYVANLLKLSGVKYRFRLWDKWGTRLNTITEDRTGFSPPDVIEELVDSINSNATLKKYINVRFVKETTEAMSDSINIGDGQRLTGGR